MSTPPTPARTFSKNVVLVLLCVAQFMVILDVSIVNIALPSIQRDLNVSQGSLQWVVIAYGLTLGGFLLLGGRCADLLGRRKIFMAGITLFTVSSLACGLASSISFLIMARATQGLGAALTAPAALSILTTVFHEGAERNKALGIWGALGGSGAAVGVLLGGILTEGLGWEWIFFLNVPIGIAVLVLAPRVLPESSAETGRRHFDIAGAVSVTTGLILAVYAVHHSIDHGWGSTITVGGLVAAAALLAGFLLIESRAKWPLMPLSIFRNRTLSVANVLALLVFGTIFSLFFVLSFYLQQVLNYSALRAGVSYLPIALTLIVAATASSKIVTKTGPMPLLAVGMSLAAIALVLFAQAPVDGDYLTDLLPGFLLGAAGLGMSVVPVQVAAFSGVHESESGLAAGLINTSQEIGGALMVAVVANVSVSKFRSALAERGGDPSQIPAALTEGFHLAFYVGAALAVGAVILAVTLLRKVPAPQEGAVIAG